MAEPPATVAPPEQRCPECGWRSSLPPARVRELRTSRRSLRAAHAPTVVVALALAALAVWLWAGRTPYILGGFTGDKMIYPGVSGADLERVAAGDPLTPGGPPDELLGRLLAAIERPDDIYFEPGNHGVSVGFIRPGGSWSERREIGWPLTVFDRSRLVHYTDLLQKQGFEAAVTDEGLPPITDWSFPADARRMPRSWRWRIAGETLTLRPAPEQTGGKPTMMRISVGALAPLAASLSLAGSFHGGVSR
jgi:hypothetical protein